MKRPHIHYRSRALLDTGVVRIVRGVRSRRARCGWWRERRLLTGDIGEVTCGRCRALVLR